MKTHGGTPYTPENCKIDLSKISDYLENFIAVVSDKVGNVNRKGKHHSSIIGSPLIPITSLSNIVPPVLHITLGIVLKLFEMILSEVRKLDRNHITAAQKEIEKEWKAESKKLKEKKNDMYNLCHKLLDMVNFKEGFAKKNLKKIFQNKTRLLKFVVVMSKNKKYNLAVDFFVWRLNLMTN